MKQRSGLLDDQPIVHHEQKGSIMGSKYHVFIEKLAESDETLSERVVSAFGSLKLASAAVKEGVAEIEGRPAEFSAVFTEVKPSGDREITRVTGNARTVSLVLADALKQERKQAVDA